MPSHLLRLEGYRDNFLPGQAELFELAAYKDLPTIWSFASFIKESGAGPFRTVQLTFKEMSILKRLDGHSASSSFHEYIFLRFGRFCFVICGLRLWLCPYFVENGALFLQFFTYLLLTIGFKKECDF